MTEREHATRTVQQLYFAMLDASLFLNSHPSNSSALRYFQNAKKDYQQAAATYEKNFGPLYFTNAGDSTWEWVDSPWPWEGVK